MQWKFFFSAISLLSTLSLSAQGPRVDDDSKKNNAKENQVTLGANAKVLTLDSLALGASTGKQQLAAAVNTTAPSSSALLNAHPNAVKPRELVANDKFKHVPLAGELDYYGKNNKYMINYVKNYLSTRNKTLRVVNGRSSGIFPVMDKILKQHEIPAELK